MSGASSQFDIDKYIPEDINKKVSEFVSKYSYTKDLYDLFDNGAKYDKIASLKDLKEKQILDTAKYVFKSSELDIQDSWYYVNLALWPLTDNMSPEEFVNNITNNGNADINLFNQNFNFEGNAYNTANTALSGLENAGSGQSLVRSAKQAVGMLLLFVHKQMKQIQDTIKGDDVDEGYSRLSKILTLKAVERNFLNAIIMRYNVKPALGTYGFTSTDRSAVNDIKNFNQLVSDVKSDDTDDNKVKVVMKIIAMENVPKVEKDVNAKDKPKTPAEKVELGVGYDINNKRQELIHKLTDKLNKYDVIKELIDDSGKKVDSKIEKTIERIGEYINSIKSNPGAEEIILKLHNSYLDAYRNATATLTELKKNPPAVGKDSEISKYVNDYKTNQVLISVYYTILDKFPSIINSKLQSEPKLKQKLNPQVLATTQVFRRENLAVKQKLRNIKKPSMVSKSGDSIVGSTVNNKTKELKDKLSDVKMPVGTFKNEKEELVAKYLWNFYVEGKGTNMQRGFIRKFFKKHGVDMPTNKQETFEKVLLHSKDQNPKCMYDGQFADSIYVMPTGVNPEEYQRNFILSVLNHVLTPNSDEQPYKFLIPVERGFLDRGGPIGFKIALVNITSLLIKYTPPTQLGGGNTSNTHNMGMLPAIDILTEQPTQSTQLTVTYNQNQVNSLFKDSIEEDDIIELMTAREDTLFKSSTNNMKEFVGKLNNSRILIANDCEDLGPDDWKAISFSKLRDAVEEGTFGVYLYGLLTNPYNYRKHFTKRFDSASIKVLDRLCGASDPLTCAILATRAQLVGAVNNQEKIV